MYEGAVIILGHGGRLAESVQMVADIAALYQQQAPKQLVRHAFLEFSAPDLETCVADLVAETEVQRICIVPLLLAAGVHYYKQIPELMARLAEVYPEHTFRMGRPIGADPRLVPIIEARVAELLNE